MAQPDANTGRRRGRRVTTSLSEINVIPLVDVMLVLLIIFMVAAPMMMVGVPVQLPRTAAARIAQTAPPLIPMVNPWRSRYSPRSSIWRDRIAENSSAKPSSRWACRFTSVMNLL